ncbi:hypothetical protein A2609_01130 [Candidatus Kaiserbacteria bacterium RIFOXYD1_FULL_47_14]|uniref:Uncharacterized protein n=1 Tax=Candidatus Kaiserbacteria bacterium RIFOXYD1_FULL_47_14 TaxID=1798533 RepID=A0A1F6G6V2_9BACT|nr:MAG: hypothetical protein A2609_01130 [Candidatus Kaiserbacteria bacterium RIFOXYD1_FULL_47_14]
MKIQFNKQLDKEVYLAFCDAVVGGTDFGKKIRDEHPDITKENYSDYIDSFYASEKEMLENTLRDTEKCFDEIKDTLFSELQKYFSKDYREEKYTCYLSIFDCNPRYLESKSFQVYYQRSHTMRKEVIAHELTHFAFYDFCNELGIKDSDALWELSEIFNVIFLNLPPLQEAIGAEELLFYPDLKDKLEEIKQIWTKYPDAKYFIEASLRRNLLFVHNE